MFADMIKHSGPFSDDTAQDYFPDHSEFCVLENLSMIFFLSPLISTIRREAPTVILPTSLSHALLRRSGGICYLQGIDKTLLQTSVLPRWIPSTLSVQILLYEFKIGQNRSGDQGLAL